MPNNNVIKAPIIHAIQSLKKVDYNFSNFFIDSQINHKIRFTIVTIVT